MEFISSCKFSQRYHDLNVVSREESSLPVHLALQPVIVNLVCQGNHVPLVETKLTLILGLKVIESSSTRAT